MGIKNKSFLRWMGKHFKGLFSTGGHKQIEEVKYFDKYAPVVAWYTDWAVFTLGFNQGWATKKV